VLLVQDWQKKLHILVHVDANFGGEMKWFLPKNP